jgi:hypothetical protein
MLRSVVFCALAVLLSAKFVEAAQTASTPPAATQRFEMTLTSTESDGSRVVQTRRLNQAEAIALGVAGTQVIVGGEVAHGTANGAPPLPNPPLPGSIPISVTRVDYHQELNGWTRDTSYGRVPGGEWGLLNDHLVNTGGPPKCNPNDDDCGRLPN